MAMREIPDSDVRILASCSLALQGDYSGKETEWVDSPFGWIKTRPSRQIGVVGEKLVAGWLATKGFDVVRSPDSQADRIVNGRRAEIKFSSLWKNGIYKFQQLRDQNYDFAICLGVSPFDAHCWVIPKDVILLQWKNQDGLVSQHGGAGGQDTAWLSVSPEAVPEWLQKYGWRLASAAQMIAQLTGKPPLP